MKEHLCKITGIKNLDEKFGEPFISAFKASIPNGGEEIIAVSYICSLFLSTMLNKFPTAKLNVFVHYIKEEFSLFSFNCKMYDTIFSNMDNKKLEHVALLDKNGDFVFCKCSKQDIFEAFDFYTNG